MTGAALALATALGLVFGSFLGVLIARIPVGEGVIHGRSRCDACGRDLGFPDLVPVVSWVLLRGRCRTCRTRVTGVWTLVELATAGLFLIAVTTASDAWSAVLVAPFLGVLLALTIIDVRTLRLPDRIVLPTAGLAVAGIIVGDLAGGSLSTAGAVVGAAAYGGGLWLVYEIAYRAYRGREAMGFGDVKVAALIGLVVGAVDLGSVAVAAGSTILLGGVVATIALLRGTARGAAIPYGPILAAGALVAVVAGPRLFDAYLGLFS